MELQFDSSEMMRIKPPNAFKYTLRGVAFALEQLQHAYAVHGFMDLSDIDLQPQSQRNEQTRRYTAKRH